MVSQILNCNGWLIPHCYGFPNSPLPTLSIVVTVGQILHGYSWPNSLSTNTFSIVTVGQILHCYGWPNSPLLWLAKFSIATFSIVVMVGKILHLLHFSKFSLVTVGQILHCHIVHYCLFISHQLGPFSTGVKISDLFKSTNFACTKIMGDPDP